MALLTIALVDTPPSPRPTPDRVVWTAAMVEYPWLYLGEFTRGIGMGAKVRFLVERSTAELTLHRIRYSEGFGREPSLVAFFTEPAASPTIWQAAWRGDRLSPGIEADARLIAR
ncbi:hypothetical protein [Glycomyces dulcitolivorans]|jgi:hypothetical protein|uniref:hypothetical protein n=1 Tax=Glycomyces dulcitolivorans TaxID=2200759 RepID=UPI000DD37CFC|nr:hypothetical protein [Glycomyces dulcitolivorans]